jgi:hypothetical protein
MKRTASGQCGQLYPLEANPPLSQLATALDVTHYSDSAFIKNVPF